MLCTSCRRHLLLRLPFTFRPSPSSLSRSVATVPTTQGAAPSQPPPSTAGPQTAPAALSSSTPGISQPLSTPTLPSTSTSTSTSAAKRQPGKDLPKPTKLQGSIPGGAVLHGVAYLKAKPAVLAMEDDAYPEWLWGLLDGAKESVISGDAADLLSMTKKQRQKYERKQEKLLKTVPKRIPVHEQSKDLTGPGDDAVVSLERRQEITKSSRVARRKGIRENNFLRSM